ncbi:MAG: ABC transporter substrate-binding protein [Spirochaetaceae bacterium]|jgi:raffinose/stachyose/melibiose transport system substrate-binding protein|nr:ABC transporter substrate-binding protein [Spirochaetaceae bacterium]
MKKLLILTVAVLTLAAVFIACKGKSETSPAASGAAAGGVKEITLVSNKIEIDAALKAYALVYEQQTGIKVNVKSFGGESPYAPNIAAMFNSGTEPEIFVIEGKSGYEDAQRSGRISDLSNEPWVKDTDVAYVDPANGNVIGFPVAIEGWGLGYNKALLAKAGIDPASMVNIAGIKAAFAKINSMKDELGIEAVVSMVSGPGMTWVTGLHGVNAYLALGLPYTESSTYINMLLNGEVDRTRLTKYAEYYELLFKNSNRNTLLTGGYDQQMGDFALQRTVFIHQGNWTDPTFLDLLGGSTFEMGYVPHAFLDETTDGIFVGAPSFYLVNPKSAGTEEAKKFLTAMASTPAGHDYMVNKAGMVPAFKSCTLQPAGELSKAVQQWTSAGKIYAWQQNEMPDGFGMNTLGPIFAQLAAEQVTVAGFVDLFAAAAAELKK